jgi:hypothetical protein
VSAFNEEYLPRIQNAREVEAVLLWLTRAVKTYAMTGMTPGKYRDLRGYFSADP